MNQILSRKLDIQDFINFLKSKGAGLKSMFFTIIQISIKDV